jgi:hypothetical protein
MEEFYIFFSKYAKKKRKLCTVLVVDMGRLVQVIDKWI